MSSDLFLYFGAVVVVFAFAAWAGWAVAGRRASTPKILPDRVWLCAACKSFNDPTHATCYRCHQPRPDDARFVVPDPEFRIDQQLGRAKGSTQLGASSPWLAGEEPLRDAWLSEQARASEQALQASEPAPAFWTAVPPDGTDRAADGNAAPDVTPAVDVVAAPAPPPGPSTPPDAAPTGPAFAPFWDLPDAPDPAPGPATAEAVDPAPDPGADDR